MLKSSSSNKCQNNTPQDNNNNRLLGKASNKVKWFNSRHRIAKRRRMEVKMGLLLHRQRLVVDIRTHISHSMEILASWILLKRSQLIWLSDRSNLKWCPKLQHQLIAMHRVKITTHKIFLSTTRLNSKFCKLLKDRITKCSHKHKSSLIKDTIQ